MRDSSEGEFYADFGDSLADAELDALLERARVADDRQVRLLVKQYLGMRATARQLLSELDAASDLRAVRDGENTRFLRALVES